MPKFYPMMMNLKERTCLVVGGGDVAARKIEMLVSCGAKVVAVAPEIDESLAPLINSGDVKHLKEEFRAEHADNAVLAIAATDNETVNRAVYDCATKRGIPVNVVDVPHLCTFIVPSIVESGDLLIAISTSGKSPAFSKRIRKELQKKFGPEYGEMLEIMGKVRDLYKDIEPDLNKRMKTLSAIANSNLLDRLRAGEHPDPEEVIEQTITE
ncbi:MAG: bifunctional precorrin-2 dehydrogenase/sirohydrochlorin ferrochelatase [Nitrospinota bacterium]|nr:bifunctional precorrin-2 dehydrogenase/sirohydrochlorin ferrochelatase [Nitrospinota bacterium]